MNKHITKLLIAIAACIVVVIGTISALITKDSSPEVVDTVNEVLSTTAQAVTEKHKETTANQKATELATQPVTQSPTQTTAAPTKPVPTEPVYGSYYEPIPSTNLSQENDSDKKDFFASWIPGFGQSEEEEKELPASALVENVPFLNQKLLGYPMGCEAVSATMVLRYYGYDVKVEDVVAAVPSGAKKEQINGVWYGADPFKEFVGDPRCTGSQGAYGCFAPPLVIGMQKFAGDRVKNISGCSLEELYGYVADGKPVVIWGASNDAVLRDGVDWYIIDENGNLTGETFHEIVREHCMVLVGYDENNVILNNPNHGAYITQPKSMFTSNWNKLYCQAIIIE